MANYKALGELVASAVKAGYVPHAARAEVIRKLRDAPLPPKVDFTGYNLFDYSSLGQHHIAVPQRDLPRKTGSRAKGGGYKETPRMQGLLDDPLIAEGIDEAVRRGTEYRNWYDVSPFSQAFLDARPDQAALDRFYGYQTLASARNPVPIQLRSGSYLWTLGENGQLTPDANIKLPKGYGGLAQKNIVEGSKRLAAGESMDPLDYPKRASYIQNWQGNLKPGTMDTHAVRLPAMLSGNPEWLLRDIRDTNNAENVGEVIMRPRASVVSGELPMEEAIKRPGIWESAPRGSEYRAMESLYQDAAKRAGMETGQAQASGWVGAGGVTGLKTYPQLFLQAIEDRVKQTALERNITPAQVIRDLALAKPGSFLRSAAPIGATAVVAGTLAPTEDANAGVGNALAKIPQKSFTRRIGPDPEKVIEGYRALRLFPSRPGETFPAMINQGLGARTPEGKHVIEGIPMEEWLQSEYMPAGAAAKGIKGRKGWHAGEAPTAPQFNLTKGADAGMQPPNMVWSDVSLDATRDWQKEADKLGNPKSPYYRSELPVGEGPDGGFYRYRNKPDDSPWIISDAVRHNRIMTDEEVNDILRTSGLEPTPRAGGAWTQERLRKAGLIPAAGAAAVGAGTAPDEAEAGIGGVLARGADLDMLKLAQEAAEGTKLPQKKIYDATGWTRGADDNWKFEIDDSQTKFKDRKLNDTRMVIGPARSVAKGSNMLEQYPDLGDVRVKWEHDPLKQKGVADGYYQRVRDPLAGRTIEKIEGKSNDDYQAIGHEFQHAIQRREGFARGGSPEEFYGPRVLAKRELEDQIDVIHDKLPKAIGKPLYSKLMDKRQALLDKMEAEGLMSQEEMRLASFNDYRNLAGEVEARNVQKRMPLTPDERRMAPFPETEDVPRNQQILKYAPAVGVGGLTLAGTAEASPAPKASSGIGAMARRYQADKAGEKLAAEQAQGAAAGSDAARTHAPLAPAAGLSELKEVANPINWASFLAGPVAGAGIDAVLWPRELDMEPTYDEQTGEWVSPNQADKLAEGRAVDDDTAAIMWAIRKQLEGAQ